MKIKTKKYDYHYEEKTLREIFTAKKVTKLKILRLALVFIVPVIFVSILFGQTPILIESGTIPDIYYTHNSSYENKTIGDLACFIDNFEYPTKLVWSSAPINIKTFDCSEASAYLEWALEKEGFHAFIATSTGQRHAWVVVKDIKVSETKTRDFAIESTTLEITHCKARYRSYDMLHDTIYETLEHHPYSEYNWWDTVKTEEGKQNGE